MIGGPSERALDASAGNGVCSGPEALEAAHDPQLGLDRSVCLRDVVDFLRADDLDSMAGHIHRQANANEIERHFTRVDA